MIIIHLARKPLAHTDGSVVQTVLHQGTGGLNINGCRLGYSAEYEQAGFGARYNPTGAAYMGNFQELLWAQRAVAEGRPISESKPHPGGRWPANLILEHTPDCLPKECSPACPVVALDVQSGESKSATGVQKYKQASTDTAWRKRKGMFTAGREYEAVGMGDAGGASRFFKQVGE